MSRWLIHRRVTHFGTQPISAWEFLTQSEKVPTRKIQFTVLYRGRQSGRAARARFFGLWARAGHRRARAEGRRAGFFGPARFEPDFFILKI